MRKGPIENSTRSNIIEFIKQKKEGTIFIYEDFIECGNYSNIRSSVVRICEDNTLVRVAQGLYMKPYADNPNKMPSHLELAQELARRTHSCANPIGDTKRYFDGEIRKMPKKLYFETSGATRRITLYDGTVIQFYQRSNF